MLALPQHAKLQPGSQGFVAAEPPPLLLSQGGPLHLAVGVVYPVLQVALVLQGRQGKSCGVGPAGHAPL